MLSVFKNYARTETSIKKGDRSSKALCGQQACPDDNVYNEGPASQRMTSLQKEQELAIWKLAWSNR